MAIASFPAFQHIDCLEDTSESWFVTLDKSTPLGEECAGFWDWAQTESQETETKPVNTPALMTKASRKLLSVGNRSLPLGSLHSRKWYLHDRRLCEFG